MAGTLNDLDWTMLLQRIKRGECTPFLGAGAAYPALPLGSTLAREMAERHQYPLENPSDLVRVTQYVAVQTDPLFPKLEVLDAIAKAKPPDFALPNEPHGVLADLPLKYYFTTNYDDYMVRALVSRGKHPQRELFRWNSELAQTHDSIFDTELEHEPTSAGPIVFHLHGHNEVPDSLVLTEDDYLDFLVNVSSNRCQVPHWIERALARNTLLFIGYSLADWSFRVIFQSLVNTRERSLQRGNFMVQVLPLPPDAPEEERRRVQHYLDKYFNGKRIRVYWGTAAEFCQELRERAMALGFYDGN
jgi:hypothetical protein